MSKSWQIFFIVHIFASIYNVHMYNQEKRFLYTYERVEFSMNITHLPLSR